MKAKIISIRPGARSDTYTINMSFPEFPAAGGSTQMLVFEASLDDYQAWTPPGGVSKTPSNYIEYEFVRPAYDKLDNIHSALKPLVGAEYDW